MDVKKRLEELLKIKGWTMYRLSKEADLAWSTVRNVFKRGTDPTIGTLEIYCKALNISLSQFFDVDRHCGLTEEQHKLVDMWSVLDEKDQHTVMNLLESLANKKR